MIYLRKSGETYDSGQFKCFLNPYECIVHGELNGELNVTMLIDSKSGVERGDTVFVKVPSLDNLQMFRVHTISTDIEKELIRVEAWHIFYDLRNNYLIDVRPTNLNAASALSYMLNHTAYSTDFAGNSDLDAEAQITAYWEYMNPVEALIGDTDNSVINRWGGELKRDNLTVNILERVSSGNGSDCKNVYYGRDLLELNLSVSDKDVITRIIPTGLGANNEIIRINGDYVDSTHINDYPMPRIARYHYSDVKLGETGYETVELVRAELQRRALAEFAKGIDLPKVSGTVSLVNLARTVEYENISDMLKLLPYDDVKIFDKDMSEYITRLVAFDFNVLTDNYDSVTFGEIEAKKQFKKLVKKISKS